MKYFKEINPTSAAAAALAPLAAARGLPARGRRRRRKIRGNALQQSPDALGAPRGGHALHGNAWQ